MLPLTDATAVMLSISFFVMMSLCCEVISRQNLGWGPLDSVEIARKIIHAVSGLILAVFPWLIQDSKSGIALALLVAAVMTLAYAQYRKTQRFAFFFAKRSGAQWFVMALILCLPLLRDHRLAFSAGFLVLGFADPLASAIGTRWPSEPFFKKSRLGSLTHFTVGLAILVVLMTANGMQTSHAFLGAALVSFVATLCEALATRGSDNLVVPVSVAMMFQLIVS